MSLFSRTQWMVSGGGGGAGGSGQVLVSGVASASWVFPIDKRTGDLFKLLSKLGIKSSDKFSTVTVVSGGGGGGGGAGFTVTLPQPAVSGVNYKVSYNTIPKTNKSGI